MPSNDHEALYQFFTYRHLPAHLQAISKVFAEQVHKVVENRFQQHDVDAVYDFVEESSPPGRNIELRALRAKLWMVAYSIHLDEGEARLRIFLEAKDCAVRAVLFKPGPYTDPGEP